MKARALRPPVRRWARTTAGVAGLVATLLVAQALPAQAGSRSYDDREVVQLTDTGLVRGAGGLALHLTARQDVRASNLALARTTCDDCRATAISFQIVVADKGPESVGIANLADARNTGCARCEAVAVAYQFVLASPKDLVLSVAGRLRLQGIDVALHRLARSGASATDLQSAAYGYALQVLDILGSEISVRPTVREQVRHITGPGSA